MQIRTFRFDDLPELVAFMNRYAEAVGKSTRVSVEQIERTWRAPYNHPEQDAFVAISEDDKIIGYTIADLLDEPHYAFGVYSVMPDHSEVGQALIDATTEHFRGIAFATSPADVDIAIDWMIPHTSKGTIAWCESQGFTLVRQFFKMHITLDQPINVLPLPAGFVRHPFEVEQLETVIAAKFEAFQDHWGNQHDTLDEWRHAIEQDNFDASLWWVIYAGNEIAGVLMSYLLNEHSGYVTIVGVKSAWRKRGLAQAMLTQCFAAHQKRGVQDVYLDVDGDNYSTNALALYQRAGMQVHDRRLYYRHVLREANKS